MSNLQKAWEKTAAHVIHNMNARGFEGHYCNTKEEAVALALSMMSQDAVVGWGGSETLKETGMMDALRQGSFTLVDRMTAKTPEEQRQMHARMVMTDYYFMSANAITLDGKLMNIDGNGNRVSCLIHGPLNVIVLAGMNKVVANEEAAFDRIRNFTSPANGVRLGLETPCAKTGVCHDCLSPDCMCSAMVTMRRSRVPNRIKFILIGEPLGY